MRTFLAFLHMGSVECVTVQVRTSHSGGGGVKIVEGGWVVSYLSGERRMIEEVLMVGSRGVFRDGEASILFVGLAGESSGVSIGLEL